MVIGEFAGSGGFLIGPGLHYLRGETKHSHLAGRDHLLAPLYFHFPGCPVLCQHGIAVLLYGHEHIWLVFLAQGQKGGARGPAAGHTPLPAPGGAAAAIALPLFGGIYLLLHHHTDSPIPFMDAFIATLGIIATWMLARKILFNWIIWIVSDSCAVILYISRDMWPTALLYVIYLGMAFYGYFSWKRSIKHRTS